MPQELMLLQQLLGFGSGWLQAVLLAGLLVVLVFRPERIGSRGLFHAACWCFAISVLAPPLLNVLFAAIGGGSFTALWGRGGMGGSPLVMAVTTLVGPSLFAVSLLFALLSLLPARSASMRPPKHPLE